MEDRESQLLAVVAGFLSLTTVAVVLRFYVRLHLQKRFGLDDWLVLAAWV
jgi:hypothetical protein